MTRNKVARLIREYEMGTEYGSVLEDLWTRESPQRQSLRDLADKFNRDILRSAMDDAGIPSVQGEVANYYRILTEESETTGTKTEVRERLERDGIDVDKLLDDFVTYQAIRSYLTEHRDAEYDPSESRDSRTVAVETIQQLENRLGSVTETHLDLLQDSGDLSIGQYRLFVDVDVLCVDCGGQYDVLTLLDRGHCSCVSEEPD